MKDELAGLKKKIELLGREKEATEIARKRAEQKYLDLVEKSAEMKKTLSTPYTGMKRSGRSTGKGMTLLTRARCEIETLTKQLNMKNGEVQQLKDELKSCANLAQRTPN